MTITAYLPETAWIEQAACSDADVGLFYDQGSERAMAPSLTDLEAIAVCNACPVIEQCLKAALDRDERWGIWGGKTPTQRAEMAGRPKKTRVKREPMPKPVRKQNAPGSMRRSSRTIPCPDCGKDMDGRATRCLPCSHAARVIDIDHGTYGGAQMHRKRGIEMCDPCADALKERQREYSRIRRLKRREAA